MFSERDYTCSAGLHLHFRRDNVGSKQTAFFSCAVRGCKRALTSHSPRLVCKNKDKFYWLKLDRRTRAEVGKQRPERHFVAGLRCSRSNHSQHPVFLWRLWSVKKYISEIVQVIKLLKDKQVLFRRIQSYSVWIRTEFPTQCSSEQQAEGSAHVCVVT